jgi:hypothetical protein
VSPIDPTGRLYPDMTTPDREHVLPDTLHLVVIPRRPTDEWALRGDYVEVVWAEILGPTTTAVARRLGRAAAALEIDLPNGAITGSLGVSPRKALDALRRLHHYGLIEFYFQRFANVALSGWVPSVPGRVAVSLSSYARQAYGDPELDAPVPVVSLSRGRGREDLEPSR